MNFNVRCYTMLLLLVISFYIIAIDGQQDFDVTMFVFNTKIDKMYNLTCVYSGSDISSSIFWGGYNNKKSIEDFGISDTYDLVCDILLEEKCLKDWASGNWNVKNSLDFHFGHVSDYRLEKFPTMKYLNIINGKSEIPITLSSKWNVLELSNDVGSKTTITLNVADYITLEGRMEGSTWTRAVPTTTYNKYWNNVLLKFNSSTFSFSYYNDNYEKVFTKTTNNNAIKTIFANSDANDWIVHNYTFIFTETINGQKLGASFELKDVEYYCVSMFVAMCNKCKLQLFLFVDGIPINKETFTNKDTKWRQIKFVTRKRINGIGSFYFNTISEQTEPFWAIDYIQRCSLIDMRYSVLRVPVTQLDHVYCNLPQHKRVLHVKRSTPREDPSNCEVNQFGKLCLNCSLLFEDDFMCNRRSECYNDNDNAICNCRIGYYGQHCYNKCLTGSYGEDCGQTCGYCNNQNCDYVTGKCEEGCSDNFVGDLCSLPPHAPVALYPPVIIQVNYTTVLVKVNTTNVHNENLAEIYYFQYAEITSRTWQQTSQFYWKSNKEFVSIQNLNTRKRYKIQTIIIYDNNNEFNKFLPNSTFKTKCRTFAKDEIFLYPTNMSLNIDTQAKQELCKLNDCTATLKMSNDKIYNGHLDKVSNLKLNSSTYYDLIVKCPDDEETLELRFKTKPKILNQVQNVNVTSGINSLHIKWDIPKNTEGMIDSYILNYKMLKRLSCQLGRNDTLHTINITDMEYNLIDLQPFSQYFIVIQAFNGLIGEIYSSNYNTLPTELIEARELSDVITVEAKQHNLTISLDESECFRINGPIFCKFEIDCMNDWCNKTNQFQDIHYCKDIINNTCNIPVMPFTNYSIVFNCGRKDGFYETSISKSLQTPPSEPGNVRQLEVYMKSYNYLSIRWKPPYPPNGIINYYKYFINWQNNYDLPKMNCTLWEGFYCHTIYKLTDNKNYQIRVKAYNKKVSYSNEYSTISAKTKPGQPSKPLNVTSSFDESNTITIKWTHPDKPNAPLSKFRIDLPVDIDNKPIYIPYNERVNYEYKTNRTDLFELGKIYELDISAVTTFEVTGEKTTFLLITPPPVPALSETIHVHIDSNEKPEVVIPPCVNFKGFLYILVINHISMEEEMTLLGDLNNCIIPNNLNGWIAAELQECSGKIHYPLGSENSYVSRRMKNLQISNKKLSDESYKIIVFLLNEFENITRCKYEQSDYVRTELISSASSLKEIIITIIIICLIGIVVFVVFRKRKGIMDWRSALTMRVLDANASDEIPLTNKTEKSAAVVKPKLAITSKKDDTFRKEIDLVDFENYVKESLQSGQLDAQHKLFVRGQTKPWSYGMLPENKFKNRYNNLIAYDDTRVKLIKENNDSFSDYINANYIEGYNCRKAYIATQGPKPLTVNDFWKMIWQENVKYIVMVANITENGKKKCEKYWPDINTDGDYGKINVKFESTIVHANFEQRMFIVKNEGSIRHVEHLHFLSWPDHGVPLYAQSLLPFLRKILTIPQETSPIVVHCSAGVGRTGTIILCDICLRMAARDGKVDLLYNLFKLREQRPNMVDNIEQYKLVHLVLLECLFAPETAIMCDQNIEDKIEKILAHDIEKQLNYLMSSMWKDNAMERMMINENDDTEIKSYPEKDRFPDIVPEPHMRLYVTRYPYEDESSSYINAVKVDGFQNPKRYIVTQQPMPNTIGDFWRLIHENNVNVIISLNDINLKKKGSCHFWPTNKKKEFNPVPYLYLEFSEVDDYKLFTIYTMHLYNSTDNDVPEKKLIQLVQVKNWSPGVVLPKYPEQLLDVLEVSDRYSCGNQPTVITCFDGATASGLFAAASFIIDEVKMEQVCDVCLAVRTIRHSRKKFLQDKVQFQYLYEITLRYLKTFETYSNFTTRSKENSN